YQFREGRNPARVRGTIEQISPQGVSIKTADGTKEITADQIVRVVFEGQPTALTRARERFEDQQFSESLEALGKMTDDPAGQKWQPEADYLRAIANAELSLSGGSVTAQAAGKQVNQFLVAHPESYLKFPAMERLGKLLFAFGRMKNASQSFDQLTQSGWPKYQRIGSYWHGVSEREQGNYDKAISLFKQMNDIQSGDAELETWQKMGACQIARCQGESGNADSAIASLKKIVAENPENANLFATAFNSLGSVYLEQNQLKEARTEFLKTELLYPTAVNEHAEALYYLTKIWAKLNENDRAISTKETLKSLYPNSWWATRE
ncbi:tetratricopeptide repeat protein, partial [Mariniblastus sp.]|nr:tetratricopeptide repeat protein [Mariniblastus sp.]